MRISKNSYIQLFLHLSVWLLLTVVLFIYPALAYKGIKLPTDFTIKQIVHLLLMLAAYYVNAYWLVPALLLKRRYWLFTAGMLLFVFISAYILSAVEDVLDLKEQMRRVWGEKPSVPFFDMFGFLTTLITLGISTSIAVITKWNADNKTRLHLEKERITMELSLLKAQIHPHFFFNTLNSIYSLSYTDAELSRKVLTKLSAIMRYLLHEANQDQIAFEKELLFIRNYVAIMQLRMGANTEVLFSYPENPLKALIAPTLLMSYVENVFKHGVDESDHIQLVIQIEQHNTGIRLRTRNRIAQKPAFVVHDLPGGIGMQNTLRRLELLYKERYTLAVREHPGTNEFELELELELL